MKCRRYCCVYGCLNKLTNETDLSFFMVPQDVERRRQWLTVIDREDLMQREKLDKTRLCNFVCSAHFDDSAIITTTIKRLKKDTIPTKLLPHTKMNSTARNLIISTKMTPAQALPGSSKDLLCRSLQKDNHFVCTYNHATAQTENQLRKPDIDKSDNIIDKSFNKLKQLLLAPSVKSPPVIYMNEPTTSTLQTQSKVCILSNEKVRVNIPSASTSTQTDSHTRNVLNKTTQTIAALPAATPRKKKFRREIMTNNCKRRRLEQEYIKIEKELEAKNASLYSDSEDEVTQRFMKLMEWQNKIKNKFKSNRYDADYKIFALNLHYASPHAYRFLQTILKLPSKTTLSKLKVKIPPKLDEGVLNSLSLKMKSLPANAKYCTICVDEMVLKRSLYYDIKKDEVIGFHNINGTITPEIASSAYVIMLQGLYCNWKQPLAYALLGSEKHYAELDSWINKVIIKLFGVGIEVKAIISDQESNFDEYAKVIKNVTIDRPYFFIDEHKIYYIFDVPHLLKCVRNNMLSSDFTFESNKISWRHIKTLYDHEKDKNLRLIPKITDAHVEPNNFQRMRVKYAAQIFSDSVYAALETYIDFGKITEKARETAKFIKVMDDLFDVLNSSKIKCAKKYQSAFRMSAEQKSILRNAQHMFATIISTNRSTGKVNTNQIKTFHNFQITIQSVLQLFEDLKSEGFQYLFTRRLNQDSLDIFFGSIRQQGGSCSEPTPIRFTRAFSKLFHVSMLNSDQTYCESDIYEVLLKADDIINTEALNPPDNCKPSLVALNGERDYCMDLPEENALTYVAGYLLFKCSKKHPDCKKTLEMLDNSPNLDQAQFTHFRAYNKNTSFYGNFKVPSLEIIEYVNKLETVFTQNFERYLHSNLGSEILKLLHEIQVPKLLCECFPIDYLLKLFVRLRIFSTLRFNNRNFKSGKKSIKQYLNVKKL